MALLSDDQELSEKLVGEAIKSQKMRPMAVERLMSDMKLLTAYECAADWQEGEELPKKIFNSFSWDDPKVLSALPKYLFADSGSVRTLKGETQEKLCKEESRFSENQDGLVDNLLCNKEKTARIEVDFAFNALRPKPADPVDGKQLMMELWFKARLFYYHSIHPFQFNPYES